MKKLGFGFYNKLSDVFLISGLLIMDGGIALFDYRIALIVLGFIVMAFSYFLWAKTQKDKEK
jgi:hypothetical protein